jgi:hypothetical protein
MRGFVATPDGARVVAEQVEGWRLSGNPESFGQALADKLAASGAREILESLSHD